MKKRFAVLLLAIVLTFSSSVVLAAAGGQPGIAQIVLSSHSHNQEEEGHHIISANISTENVQSGISTPPYVQVSLEKASGGQAVSGAGVSPAKAYIYGNAAKITIDLPENMPAGDYKIEFALMDNMAVLDKESVIYTVGSLAELVPQIISSSINPSGHIADSLDTINARAGITTENIPDGTIVSASLIDSSDKTVVEPKSGKIVNDSAEVILTIPGKTQQGSYRVKVEAGDLIDTSAVYTIAPSQSSTAGVNSGVSAPEITAVLAPSDLYEGSISGDLRITGKGFSSSVSENSIFIINSDNEQAGQPLTPASAAAEALIVPVPVNLTSGVYGVKVGVNGKSAIKQNVLNINKPLPAISSTAVSSDAGTVEGSVSGTIIVNGKNFSQEENTAYIIDREGAAVSQASVVSCTPERIIINIPSGLKAGEYRLRLISGNKFIDGTDTINITLPPQDMQGGNQTSNNQSKAVQTGGYPAVKPIEEIIIKEGLTPVIDAVKNIASSKISSELITDNLNTNTANDNKLITVQIPQNSAKIQEITLGIDAVKSIAANKADISINTAKASVQIPSAILGGFANSELKLTVEAIEGNTRDELLYLANKGKGKNIVPYGSVVDIRLTETAGAFEKNITSFGSKIKLELSLSGADILKLDTRKLGIYYLDEADMIWKYVGGEYNASKGSVEADTDHFTKFAIMEYNKKFEDVSDTFWGREDIGILAARHIVQGVDDRNFAPDATLTRAQFATFIARALKLPDGGYTGRFRDVRQDDWFMPYVEAAAKAGIVSGTGADTYSPDIDITREQMAAMIMNAYRYSTGLDSNTIGSSVNVGFTDMGSASDWAHASIKAAFGLKIINGMDDTTFAPRANASRAQAAAIIVRFLNTLAEL